MGAATATCPCPRHGRVGGHVRTRAVRQMRPQVQSGPHREARERVPQHEGPQGARLPLLMPPPPRPPLCRQRGAAMERQCSLRCSAAVVPHLPSLLATATTRGPWSPKPWRRLATEVRLASAFRTDFFQSGTKGKEFTILLGPHQIRGKRGGTGGGGNGGRRGEHGEQSVGPNRG